MRRSSLDSKSSCCSSSLAILSASRPSNAVIISLTDSTLDLLRRSCLSKFFYSVAMSSLVWLRDSIIKSLALVVSFWNTATNFSISDISGAT